MAEQGRQLDLLGAVADAEAFVVRVSTRARRMSIRVTPHRGVEVVVPRRARPGDIQHFVSVNKAWIERARIELASRMPPVDVSPPSRVHLPALGIEHSVRYLPSDLRRRGRVRVDGSILSVCGAATDSDARTLLRHWLKERARDWLPRKLANVSAEIGLGYRRVQVRAQRTRWGSCSSQGTISLNCCLLFLTQDEVRYLMIHELCHTRHMNHSRAFWSMVASHEPDYRACEARLDQAWRAIPGWVGMV